MTLQIKHIDLCGILLLLTTLVLGVFFIFQAYGSARKEIQLERHLLDKQQSDLTLAENNLDHLQKVLTDSQAVFDRLSRRIPDSAGIGDLLTVIHERINQRNIVLTQFSHTPPVKRFRYQRISLHLILEGRFLELYHLIHDFETMNRVFIIQSLQVTKSDKTGACRMEVMADVFQE